jgi:hypothetical protein
MDKKSSRTSESVIRRTISRPGDKNSGLYIYLGEPSKAVVDRVAGNIGHFIPDFKGKINVEDFIHNSAGKICECDCFCSCSCDCTCNCDCVCYCDCNCPCLCQSACNDYLALEDIRAWTQQVNILRDRLDIRFGDIARIIESFRAK